MPLNLDPWLRQLSITDKQARTTYLNPDWTPVQRRIVDEVQNAYNEGRPCRLICLKARQLGVSTISGGIGFSLATLFPRTSGFVVAHTSQSTMYLFDKIRHFYETWPLRQHYPTRYSSRREMVFSSNDSFIRVQTARNPDALRGRTITFFHGSEVALWEKQEEAMVAIRTAVPNAPGTVIILESTANGLGNWFERAWREAEAGINDYIPIFAPWFTHHEYIPCHGMKCIDATCEVCLDKSRIRPADEEERRLIGLGCDLPHLAWRRWALPNLAFNSQDWFAQEFPSTAEEAFLTSGVGVFPQQWLDQIFVKMRPAIGRLTGDGFVLDPTGPLRVYKPPSDDKEWGTYFIGADPAHGTFDGDYAAASVINRQTKEQVAVWHGRINPFAFADELVKLGNWYNQAVISCEVSGPGMGTVGRLAGLYPRLWHHRLIDRIPARQRSEIVLGWDCYDDQTEVLTRRGWLSFEDVTLEDEFATKDLKTGRFEWQFPTRVVNDPYRGEMMRCHSKSVDLLVTTDHKLIIGSRLRPAHEVESLGRAARRMPATSIWDADDLEWFTCPAIGRSGPFSFRGDDFAAFMGMYLAEGNCAFQTSRSGYQIQVHQKKQSKGWDDYAALLRRLLGRDAYYRDYTFYLFSRSLYEYLAPLGKSHEKHVPTEIKEMSRRQLEIFWESFTLGDGSTESTGRQTLHTVSKRMADDLQEIAQKIGMSATVEVHQPRDSFGGRSPAKNQRVQYRVRTRKSQIYTFDMERVWYEGKIGCAQVPNGTLYVRRNGKPCWSGNTNWKRKQWLVTQLADAVERQDVIIHDRQTYEEMRQYSFYGDKGDVYGPSDPQAHDDLVMALGIAVVCERVESPVPPYETRKSPTGSKVVFGEVVDPGELMEWGA